jgi:hypothetical protein
MNGRMYVLAYFIDAPRCTKLALQLVSSKGHFCFVVMTELPMDWLYLDRARYRTKNTDRDTRFPLEEVYYFFSSSKQSSSFHRRYRLGPTAIQLNNNLVSSWLSYAVAWWFRNCCNTWLTLLKPSWTLLPRVQPSLAISNQHLSKKHKAS